MSEVIGFVGVGKMGLPMAHRLLDAGYELIVHDTAPAPVAELVARGAQRADSPRAVGDVAETVLVSLPVPAIVEEVVLGAKGLARGRTARVIVDLSTTGPITSIKVGAALAATGKVLIDSPVSGGVDGAKAGTLAIMLSGNPGDRERLVPLLSKLGRLFTVGDEPGLGQTMKLVNNMLSGAAMALTSEAMTMGVKAGLDPRVMCEVINAGSGRNSATQDKFPKSILTRKFDFGFTTNLMVKDIQLFVSEAEGMNLQLKAATAVRDLWRETLDEEGPASDFSRIAAVVERRAGVEIKPKG
jgi:3-hydroxyisobutyrate dehydrogenase-like beta-hydroxyacid dehydrogenase